MISSYAHYSLFLVEFLFELCDFFLHLCDFFFKAFTVGVKVGYHSLIYNLKFFHSGSLGLLTVILDCKKPCRATSE